MTAPVSISVMGAGLIGKRHIEHILAEPMARLHSVVDPSDVGRDLARRVNAPWFADVDAMLAAGKPDGVLVATPNHLHVPHGLKVVAAGLPALIEKPFADDLEAGMHLVTVAEAAGVPLLTGHHRRHNQMIQRAKAIIDSGSLGQIITIHSFFWLMKPDDYFETEWRRQASAGPVLINLIHDLDLMRYLCGEVAEVKAYQSRAVRNHAADETTVVILKFINGALGTMNVSDTVVAPWSWEHTTGENPGYPHTDQSCYHIGGMHGSLSVPRLELWTNKDLRSWWEPFSAERITAAGEDPLRLQIRQFCKVIRGEEPPLVSGREGLATLRVIDAIRRAASTGDTVSLS